MVGSRTRPMLQVPDLSQAVAADASRPPRTDPNDSRFEGAAQFETPEALLRRVKNGSVRTLNPETMPRADAPDTHPLAAPLAAPRRRSPELSLSTKVPDYVMQQLRRRYADTNVTIRNQLLFALRRDGLEIDDVDLQDERKRPRR